MFEDRGDCLQDRFEGTYSRQQILDMEDWLREEGHPEIAQTEMERREHDRRRTYLSCWCISKYDLDLMWKAYVKEGCGVAIRSTVYRL